MAQTVTWLPNLGATARQHTSTGHRQGAGAAKRLYVGRFGSYAYESFLKFNLVSWSGIGKIVSAVLTIYTDDGFGELGDTIGSTASAKPQFAIRRLTDSFEDHTRSETFIDADNTIAAGAMTGYTVAAPSATALAVNNIDITSIVEMWAPKMVKRRNGSAGGAASNFGIGLFGAVDTTRNWAAVSEEPEVGLAAYKPYITLTYEYGTTAPNAPDTLTPAGSVTSIEAFAGNFSDIRTTDTLRYSEVEVYTSGASNSGQTVTGGTRVYARKQSESESAILAGRFSHIPDDLTLVPNATYKWRARVTDQEAQTSAWTDLVSFSVSNTAPNAPTLTPTSGSSFASLDGVLFRGGVFADADSGDTLSAYQVQLSAYASGNAHWDDDEFILWNTGKRLTTSGATNWQTPYGGAALAAGTYYWRARQWDQKQGFSTWTYATIVLTADFDVNPGDSTSIQQRPKSKWRIRIRDVADQVVPPIELVQQAVFAVPLSLVQSKTINTSGAGISLTFNTPVVAGHLVVCILVERGTSGTPRIGPSGWAEVATVSQKNDGDLTSMYWRNAVAVTDDTVTIASTTNGTRMTIMEFGASATLVDTATKTMQAQSTAHSTGPVTLSGAGLVVAVSCANDSGAPGGSNPTYTEAAGFTTLSNGLVSGGNNFSPASIHSYRAASAGSYSHAPTTDYNGEWGGIVAAFQPTLAAGWTFPAALTPGNTVFMWLTSRHTTGPDTPTGFTAIHGARVAQVFPGSQRWGLLCYRLIQEGDSGTYTLPSYVHGSIMEWSGVYAGIYRWSSAHAASTLLHGGGDVSPTPGVPSVILGCNVAGADDSPSLSVTTNVSDSVEVDDYWPSQAPLSYVAYRPSHTYSAPGSVGGTLNNSSPYGGVTAVITSKTVNRGPDTTVAIIEDAKGVGASIMYNSPGELHFTVPVDHPQLAVIEPKQVHYSVDLYRGGGWREVFAGLVWDYDTVETDVVFYGIDYLGLFDMVSDERYDPANVDKPTTAGGSKYVDSTIASIISASLSLAIHAPNSPVGFIELGTVSAALSEKVTIWSTFEPTLSFVAGLIDSHRQGTGKKTRVQVVPTTAGGYRVQVVDAPGTVRDNLRMKYGELIQGYRVIPFGTDWASRMNVIGRARDGLKVMYKTASAPGIDQAVWGRISQTLVLENIADENDLIRRMKQAAIHAGKFGKHIALGIRVGLLGPLDGYDITDSLPVEIVHGAVDTRNFGSGYWDLFGLLWNVGDKQEQTINMTLLPREDSTEPSADLINSAETHPQAEWGLGYAPPDGTSAGPTFFMDVATGIIYQRDESTAAGTDGTGLGGEGEVDP